MQQCCPEPCGVCTLTSFQDIGIKHGLWLALTYTKSEIKKKLCKNSTAQDIFLSLKHYKEKVFVSIALSLQNMFLFFLLGDSLSTVTMVHPTKYCLGFFVQSSCLPAYLPSCHFSAQQNTSRSILMTLEHLCLENSFMSLDRYNRST